MTKIVSLLALLSSVLACLLPASPALAQRDRVFVASYGSDSNPCTFGSPCKTFQQAVDVVAQGGEVTAIDSAGFGTITISHAVTITSPNGVEAGIAAPTNGNAITITAQPSDVISLNGLTIDGFGTASVGIQFSSGGTLNVQNSVIRNFYEGLNVQTSASSQVSVSNTLVSNNSNNGIFFSTSGSGTVNAVLDHVSLEQNTDYGLAVVSSGPTVDLTISDSVSANNANSGIYCVSNNSAVVNIMVRSSTLANNVNNGVFTFNPGCQVWVTRSTIVENGVGWQADGGTITSFSDNNVIGNGANGSPSGTAGPE
jgi:hypothetical protein